MSNEEINKKLVEEIVSNLESMGQPIVDSRGVVNVSAARKYFQAALEKAAADVGKAAADVGKAAKAKAEGTGILARAVEAYRNGTRRVAEAIGNAVIILLLSGVIYYSVGSIFIY